MGAELRGDIRLEVCVDSVDSAIAAERGGAHRDRKSTRLNSSHLVISYAVFCLKKKNSNREWIHLNNADVISMPDKWEYPWYASWDLAFHSIPLPRIAARFAKNHLDMPTLQWYQ